MLYFHVCPPLAAHEIAAGLEDGSIALSRADAKRYRAALDADAKNPPAEGEGSRAAGVLAELIIERRNRRDENVVSAFDGDKPNTRAKAGGAGVEPVEAE